MLKTDNKIITIHLLVEIKKQANEKQDCEHFNMETKRFVSSALDFHLCKVDVYSFILTLLFSSLLSFIGLRQRNKKTNK